MALLDDIPGLVAGPLVDAGMTRAAVLIKRRPGIRQPGALTAGTNVTEQQFTARGGLRSVNQLAAAGTLLNGVSRVIGLLAATIQGGAVPEPGDHITMDGQTSVIVEGGVSTAGARASYVCQCR